MKKNLKHLVIVALIFITSCKKKDNPTPSTTVTPAPVTTPASSYYFKCKIDGVSWSASKPVGSETAAAYSSNGHAYVIENATSALTDQFSVAIFPIVNGWGLESSTFVSSGYEAYENVYAVGQIKLVFTIDSINRVISGTFSFPMLNVSDDKDTIKITDGELKVKY